MSRSLMGRRETWDRERSDETAAGSNHTAVLVVIVVVLILALLVAPVLVRRRKKWPAKPQDSAHLTGVAQCRRDLVDRDLDVLWLSRSGAD